MGSEDDLARLRQGLAERVRRSGQSRRSLSGELDRHPQYLGLLLQGRTPLRVEEVLHLLSVLDVRPFEFFGHHFPLGGPGMARLRQRHPREGSPLAGLPTRLLEERAVWQGGGTKLSSVALALKAGRLLAFKVRQKGLSQVAVAGALGLSGAALGRSLRGDSQLTFQVVFGVLEVIGVTPGRFFAELLGSSSEELIDELHWSWALDQAEVHLAAVVAALEGGADGGAGAKQEEEEEGGDAPGAKAAKG